MDEERKDRYEDKVGAIRRHAERIRSWGEDGIDDERNRLAIYKAYQELAEAVTDICAMFGSDTENGVGDDYENIEHAAGRLYDTSLKSSVIEINGLRNRIVHEYDVFDDDRAFRSIQKLLDEAEAFADEVAAWIQDR